MDYSFIFEKEIPCKRCEGTMVLKKNICGEYLYDCTTCRNYSYMKADFLTDRDIENWAKNKLKKPIK